MRGVKKLKNNFMRQPYGDAQYLIELFIFYIFVGY